jgi:predicted PurR-regulated permease PerM
MERWPRTSPAWSLAIGVGAVAVLYLAKPVLLPLAVAVLLNVVISPAVKRLERIGVGRLRVGRVGSVIVMAALVAGLFAGMAWVVGVQGSVLTEKLPEYRRNAIAHLREPLDSLRRLERTAQEVREMAEPPGTGPAPEQVQVVEGRSALMGLARDWAGSVASLLGTAGLVIVLLAFLLIEREALRDRVLRVAAPDDLHVSTSALGDAVDRVTHYLRALAMLNFGHGALVALGMWALGLPGALLLGLLSAVLRFVPYVGPWIAAGFALLVALASSEGWTVPLAVAGFFVVLELVSNNVLEPWLYGASVGISPFAHILSTIFWAWLWGPLGLVLATPLTACLVALGRYVPSLEPLAILLSDAQALPPAERLYQRLLARDVYEARALVAERCEKLGPLTAWDEVVLPALALLERDRQDDRLDAEQSEVARETFDDLLDELSDGETGAEPDASPAVLCLPARGGWDDTVCEALARFLRALAIPARAVGHKLSAELALEVERAGAELVCISSLAGSVGAVQHLVMRIRKRCPEATLVIGLWGRAGEAVATGAEDAVRTYVVHRLADATERVRGSTPTRSGLPAAEPPSSRAAAPSPAPAAR